MDRPSEHTRNFDRRALHIEELEERIAPVTIDATHWIQQDITVSPYPITNGWTDTSGNILNNGYWIFYVGPGQADITSSGGDANISGSFLGNITITGSDMSSGLYILEMPNSAAPIAETPGLYWDSDAGSIRVEGTITVEGDMGNITIAGAVTGDVNVYGTMGKLEVAWLDGNTTYVAGDLYELDSRTTIGVGYDFVNNVFVYGAPTNIFVDGNIGAVRAGVGLADGGISVSTDPNAIGSIIGGVIGGGTTIAANYDRLGTPGTIDLIETLEGSQFDGSFGAELGDTTPHISAGPHGNIRFLHIEGTAYEVGASGFGSEIPEVTVNSSNAGSLGLIVDDSGGRMVISPQDTVFVVANGTTTATTTYSGSVTYLAVPVDHDLQGPGVVIARLTVDNSNNFSITGSVDIGDMRFDTGVQYQEAGDLPLGPPLPAGSETPGTVPPALTTTPVSSPSDILSLQGWARDIFSPAGNDPTAQTDIYFLNAMTDHGSPGSIIPIVMNNTHDGDILTVGSGADIVFVSASNDGGDIGATQGISPYLLRGPLHYNDGNVLWVDIATSGPNVAPYGVDGSIMRSSSIQGVMSSGNIWCLRAGGAIGDVRSLGDGTINLVLPDANNMRDPGSPLVLPNIIYVGPTDEQPSLPVLSVGGQVPHTGSTTFFGTAYNDVGDGVFGKVMSGSGSDFPDSVDGGFSGGGNIGTIHVGEGLEYSWYEFANQYPYPSGSPFPNGGGLFLSSGVITQGDVIAVVATNTATDNLQDHDRGIFGDIFGSNVFQVAATNGAVIVGSFIGASTPAGRWHSSTVSGVIQNVVASGHGAVISDTEFDARGIYSVQTTGGSDGIDGCIFYANGIAQLPNPPAGSTPVDFTLNLISADGPGINNSLIDIVGIGGTVRTTDPEGIISNTQISAVAGLRVLSSHALEGDSIDVFTIGQLSSFDHITDTIYNAGGAKIFTVTHDITDSVLHVAGPLKSLTVGGNMTDVDLEATGPTGDIGRITVGGSITGGQVFSGGTMTLLQTKAGSIDTDITVQGTRGTTTIKSGGDAGGAWSIGNKLNLAVPGTLDADITAASVGTIKVDTGIVGDISVLGNASSIKSNGNITGSISVGGNLGTITTTNGGVLGIVSVTGNVSSIKSATDIGIADSTAVTINGKLGTLTAGAGDTVGNIYSDLFVSGNVGSVTATGNIAGDVNMGGNLSSMKSGGYVGTDGGTFNVVGSVGKLSVGDPHASNVYDLSSDVTIGRNLSNLAITGGLPASLHVVGNASSVTVGGVVGGSGDIFRVDGKLGKLTVGTPEAVNELVSDLTVGNGASSITVTGTVQGNMTVTGNVGKIEAGPIWSNVYITGNLNYIRTDSEYRDGTAPVDYVLHSVDPNDTSVEHFGSLRVDGTIGKHE